MDSQSLGTDTRPVRIAIVGAGPAGFYTTEALLKQPNLVCSIDLFNHFPTPFGLVREGVAPDHQSIKGVTRIYTRIAADPRVHYFGNVTFGTDIKHEQLKHYYDQIVYAVGAQADRRMGIPGEDVAGSLPATAFVGWYNSHPDYTHLDPDLAHERVIVVGNGNVAMDIARILTQAPDELAKTDIADHALAKLRASRVREVVMLGRRGPAQAAFTTAELKEFGTLQGVDIVVDAAQLELDPHSAALAAEDKLVANNLAVLRSYTAKTEHAAPRRIQMRFLVSPSELVEQDGRVAAVRIEHNQLVADDYGGLRAKGTGRFELIETGLVLRAVGYRSIPLQGVPFDEATFTIMNIAGRVVHPMTGEPVAGEYVAGWAKRGPTGVIGTNKLDAAATVTAMLEDLPNLTGIDDNQRDPALVEDMLRECKPDYVTWNEWQLLDRVEVERGVTQNRPRVKVTSVSEMLATIAQQRTTSAEHRTTTPANV